jgi:hypothetical protein
VGGVDRRDPRRERLAVDDVDRSRIDRGAARLRGVGDRGEPLGIAAGEREETRPGRA